MKKLFILLLIISTIAFQKAAAQSIVSETIDKIEMKEDKVLSVFEWVANNIRYDVAKRNDLRENNKTSKNAGFKSEAEFHNHLLKNVINKKKGVCQDYSLLFHSIITELGYESFVIKGYTKNEKGVVNRSIGHTWNAVKVDGEWKLYDPTWAAGYVKDNKKFVKRYGQQWYDVSPTEMLKRHMPCDPIWQLSSNPITYKAFESNKNTTILKSKKDYNTLVSAHLAKGKKEQMEAALERSNELGKGNIIVEKWKKQLTKSIGLFDIHSQPDRIKDLSNITKASFKTMNEYIAAKNKRFKGKKWTVPFATKTLQKIKVDMTEVLASYKDLEIDDKKAKAGLKKMIKQSADFLVAVDKELDFLKKL